MTEEENKEKKEDNKNKILELSKLKTNYDWECYKDTGNC